MADAATATFSSMSAKPVIVGVGEKLMKNCNPLLTQGVFIQSAQKKLLMKLYKEKWACYDRKKRGTKCMENSEVILTIQWTKSEIVEALEKEGMNPSEENINNSNFALVNSIELPIIRLIVSF